MSHKSWAAVGMILPLLFLSVLLKDVPGVDGAIITVAFLLGASWGRKA